MRCKRAELYNLNIKYTIYIVSIKTASKYVYLTHGFSTFSGDFAAVPESKQPTLYSSSLCSGLEIKGNFKGIFHQ